MGLAQTLSQRPSLRVSGAILDALDILGMSSPDLTEHLRRRAAANPFIAVRSPPTASLDERAAVVSASPSLAAHVTTRIDLAFRDERERRIATAFADALEPTGWLGQSLECVADTAGVSRDVAAAVLARLQRMDPPGLFANSLSECLLLQASDAGVLTWEVEALIRNLDLVAEGRHADLAELCDCEPEDIPDILAIVRGLDPKPGLAFDPDPPPPRPPDLVLRRGPEGWIVELNRETAPAIVVRAPHRSDSQALAEARGLARAVVRRGETLVAVAAALVSRQRAFLDEGPARLRPLGLSEVALDLGLSVSTISRVVAGRNIQTPARVLPLHAFLARAVGTTDPDEERTRNSALDVLRTALATEDPARPHSDAALVRLARGHGLALSRRSVARYRDLLGVASSRARRRPPAPEPRGLRL